MVTVVCDELLHLARLMLMVSIPEAARVVRRGLDPAIESARSPPRAKSALRQELRHFVL